MTREIIKEHIKKYHDEAERCLNKSSQSYSLIDRLNYNAKATECVNKAAALLEVLYAIEDALTF